MCVKNHFVSIGKPVFHAKCEPKLFYFHVCLLIGHSLFSLMLVVICATICFDSLQIIDFGLVLGTVQRLLDEV